MNPVGPDAIYKALVALEAAPVAGPEPGQGDRQPLEPGFSPGDKDAKASLTLHETSPYDRAAAFQTGLTKLEAEQTP